MATNKKDCLYCKGYQAIGYCRTTDNKYPAGKEVNDYCIHFTPKDEEEIEKRMDIEYEFTPLEKQIIKKVRQTPQSIPIKYLLSSIITDKAIKEIHKNQEEYIHNSDLEHYKNEVQQTIFILLASGVLNINNSLITYSVDDY